jgi:hypothetical protein
MVFTHQLVMCIGTIFAYSYLMILCVVYLCIDSIEILLPSQLASFMQSASTTY